MQVEAPSDEAGPLEKQAAGAGRAYAPGAYALNRTALASNLIARALYSIFVMGCEFNVVLARRSTWRMMQDAITSWACASRPAILPALLRVGVSIHTAAAVCRLRRSQTDELWRECARCASILCLHTAARGSCLNRGPRPRVGGSTSCFKMSAADNLLSACFEVSALEGRGRGLVARREIAGGDTILQEVALASVVLEEWASSVCHQCFRAAMRLSSCAQCQQVGWCSDECESVGGAAHRSGDCCECEALARLDTDILNVGDAALAKLFVKLLCKRAAELESGEGGDGEGAASAVDRTLAMLESNEEGMSEERMSDLAMIAEVVLRAVPAARIEQEVLEGYMCAEQCNSFGIWGDSGKGKGKLLGFGVFPRLCMFNHSCLPNVTISQTVGGRTRTLTAHALAPVAVGEELCISYSEAKLLYDKDGKNFSISALTTQFTTRNDVGPDF